LNGAGAKGAINKVNGLKMKSSRRPSHKTQRQASVRRRTTFNGIQNQNDHTGDEQQPIALLGLQQRNNSNKTSQASTARTKCQRYCQAG
jgi:hypothetical protein